MLKEMRIPARYAGHDIRCRLTSFKAADVCGVSTDRQLELGDNTFRVDSRYAAYYCEVDRR